MFNKVKPSPISYILNIKLINIEYFVKYHVAAVISKCFYFIPHLFV